MQAVTKIRQFYFAIPVLVLAACVLPVAFAGTADGAGKPTATISKSVKQLKKQVKALQQQVAAIPAQDTSPRPPGGPAGGDLTGVFPNPVIAPNAIGTAEIQKDAVTDEEIRTDSVGGDEVVDDSVGGFDIKNESIEHEDLRQDSVGAEEIGMNSVGPSELRTRAVGALEIGVVKTAVSPVGKTLGAGQAGEVAVTCPGQTVLLAGGFAWADEEPNSIIHSAPSEFLPEATWKVRGYVPSGSNTLYAWATCLQV